MNYDTTTTQPIGACGHCSGNGQWTIHAGTCPKVKAIEYHPNGAIKRIEFKDDER